MGIYPWLPSRVHNTQSSLKISPEYLQKIFQGSNFYLLHVKYKCHPMQNITTIYKYDAHLRKKYSPVEMTNFCCNSSTAVFVARPAK